MPIKTFTVLYTSDIHGCFSVKDGQPGLAAFIRQVQKDGNTLLVDGGDTMQGSPFSRYLADSGHGTAELTAALMNLAGYSFVTLGNHDFSYGKAELEKYIARLNAECLCANVSGVRGVKKLALVTLENGLRIGLTGVITPFVPLLERHEYVAGVTFTDPVPAAREALEALKAQGADITVCLCHMGFENDPVTGQMLFRSGENRAYEIASALGYTLVLAGHTHAAFAGGRIQGTFACAPADKLAHCVRIVLGEDGSADAAFVPVGTEPEPAAAELLAPYEEACAAFLARPIGRLSAPMPQKAFLEAALHGSPLADLINDMQMRVTGADISAATLPSDPPALSRDVTACELIRAYPFSNTLIVLEVDRAVLKGALERCASFLTVDAQGRPAIDRSVLEPVPQFYYFDWFRGLYAKADLKRPVGERVFSLVYHGEELPENKKLRLCVSNYRASGAGGYPFYGNCRVLQEGRDDVLTLLLDHVRDLGEVAAHTEKYTKFYFGKEEL